ncbi:hypothetical protein AURDEDRAFT_131060 [Auricularia subglabra TFB-10046 SS5]|nr:hypothetical protein AURDEDRAFT_131060 [Auricularia subglabra TFB-10046 SS5]
MSNNNVTYPTSNVRGGQAQTPAFAVTPAYRFTQAHAAPVYQQAPPPPRPAASVQPVAPVPQAPAQPRIPNAPAAQGNFVSGDYKCYHPQCVAGGISTVVCGSAHAWKEHMRVRHNVNV